jgi:hypothetical protein
LLKAVTTFGTKFWSFCKNESERNETKGHFMLKMPYFVF